MEWRRKLRRRLSELGGSLYLFDKTRLKHFRDDGHRWRQKVGKCVKESCGLLKTEEGPVRYSYSHGEDDPNFCRRIYNFKNEPFAHIALVHYLMKDRKGKARERAVKQKGKKYPKNNFVEKLTRELLNEQKIVEDDDLIFMQKSELLEAFVISPTIQIKEWDEEALKFLTDIKWCRTDEQGGFKLVFHFDRNPYFENSVIGKTYDMIDEDNRVVAKTTGTAIQWNTGKCLTQEPDTTEQCKSFFNLFTPPEVPGDDTDIEEDEVVERQKQIEHDYIIGSAIRDIVGGAAEDEEDDRGEVDDDYYYNEGDEDEEDYDFSYEEDDEEEHDKKKR